MKLRLRSINGGPTVRVEVPANCDLQSLQDRAQEHFVRAGEPAVRLSLNKKDELVGPGTTLVSGLGVCSGDLLYVFSGPITQAGAGSAAIEQAPAHSSDSAASRVRKEQRRDLCAAAATRREIMQSAEPAAQLTGQGKSGLVVGTGPTGTLVGGSLDRKNALKAVPMEVEGEQAEKTVIAPCLSMPAVLQRVLATAARDVRSSLDLLVLLVHAIMVEAGFTVADVTRPEALPPGWSTATGAVELRYKLAVLMGTDVGETCTLRCQRLGQTLVVYGTARAGTTSAGVVRRLSLQAVSYLVPELVNSQQVQSILQGFLKSAEEGTSHLHAEAASHGGDGMSRIDRQSSPDVVFKNLRQLWRDAKDTLSLPLLTVLRQAAGLPAPPSLMLLPAEVLDGVLEQLPPLALVAVGAVSRSLRFAAADDHLWRACYAKEYGAHADVNPPAPHRSWKSAFAARWTQRKLSQRRREEAARSWERAISQPSFVYPPYQPHIPGIVGGDYDRFPAIGNGVFRGLPGAGRLLSGDPSGEDPFSASSPGLPPAVLGGSRARQEAGLQGPRGGSSRGFVISREGRARFPGPLI